MRNRNKLLLSFLLILLFASSCDMGDPIDDTELWGKWKGISILENGKSGEWDPSKIRFEFREDSTYTYRLAGDYKETGTWYVYDAKLYTHTSNREDIYVQIDLPTPDSLVIEQLDGGVSKIWVLKRQTITE